MYRLIVAFSKATSTSLYETALNKRYLLSPASCRTGSFVLTDRAISHDNYLVRINLRDEIFP